MSNQQELVVKTIFKEEDLKRIYKAFEPFADAINSTQRFVFSNKTQEVIKQLFEEIKPILQVYGRIVSFYLQNKDRIQKIEIGLDKFQKANPRTQQRIELYFKDSSFEEFGEILESIADMSAKELTDFANGLHIPEIDNVVIVKDTPEQQAKEHTFAFKLTLFGLIASVTLSPIANDAYSYLKEIRTTQQETSAPNVQPGEKTHKSQNKTIQDRKKTEKLSQ